MTAIDDLLQRIGGPELLYWHHQHGTNISPTEYGRRLRQLRARGVDGSQRIYLDTNFWIGIRDAKPDGGPWYRLLERLRDLVRARTSICVLQQWSFYELALQAPEKLKVTAGLVDELCESVAIAPTEELRYWDAGEFVASAHGWKYDGFPGRWSCVGQILRSRIPSAPSGVSLPSRIAIGKAMLDTLTNASFADVLAAFGWNTRDAFRAPPVDDNVIAQVEARKASQKKLGVPREEVRRQEFEWLIQRFYVPFFAEHLVNANHKFALHLTDQELRVMARELAGRAIQAFGNHDLGVFLPEAALLAELYTLYVGDDSRRRLTHNDYTDWQHAVAALPLCNVFLTDGHLANQLTQKLKAHEQFQCSVVAGVDAALELLGA